MMATGRQQRVRLVDALIEVTRGVGPSWEQYRLLGATREGISPAKEKVGKAPERYKLVEPGTIFYNPMRILIGSIALLDDGQAPGITSPDYVVFRTRPNLLHHRWFYYWLRSGYGSEFIRTLARGAVRERMVFRRLASGAISVPALEVQERFAQKLIDVDRAREAAKEQLLAIEALPDVLLRQAFGGEL